MATEPTRRERLTDWFFNASPPSSSQPPIELRSSAERVNLDSEAAIQAVLKRRQPWQRQVFDAYDVCGELHNGTNMLADLLSGIVLFAAEDPDDTDALPVRTTDERVVATMKRLGSVVEVSETIRNMTMNLVLVGDLNFVGIQPGPGREDIAKESWQVFSIDEIISSGSTAKVVDYRLEDSGAGIALDLSASAGDTWLRIWRQHPRRKQFPDSHIRPLLTAIDELTWWDAAATAVAKNRLATAGIIAVPSNLETAVEAGDDPRFSGSQRWIKRFFNNAIRAIREPGSPSGAVPMMATYPWNEQGKSGIEIISLDRPQDELLEARTDRALRRIAQGFPLPVEAFFGLGEATHWGAGQIEEGKFRDTVEPFVRFLVSALTQHWLRPLLRKQGVKNWEKYMVWYDPSNIIVHPKMEEAADKGYEYGLVSGSAWRRIRGVPERDEPTPEEKEETLAWMRALRGREGNPAVQEDGEPGPEDQTDTPVEPEPGASHPPRAKKPVTSRGKGQPIAASANGNGHLRANGLGRRLAEIDDNLLTRLQVMSTEQTRRALEKAGNVIRTWSRKNPSIRASIRNVDPEDVGRTLGRDTVQDLGDLSSLFADAFDDVPALFALWCDRAVEASIEVAELPTSVVSSASFQLAYSTTDAASIFVRELKELATTLLFSSPSTDPQPEADDQLVPISMVRRALSRVGGGEKPNLLLATGRTMTKHLAEAGHFANDWEWWYPPSPRQIDQHHKQLDGGRFQIDVYPHQPGEGSEHCRCLAVPVFAT